jgi:ribosomal protein L37AE/L43A
LILSNTNPAVDQLFQNLCAGLTSGHPLVEDGKVVRLGKSLGIDEEYQEFVTVAGIVRRKSADIRARKALLAQQVQLLRLSAATMRRVLDAFAHLDAVNAECAKLAQQRANCSRELEETQAAGQREAAAAAALQAELAQRLAARWLRRMFLRSEQAIRDDLAACAARQEVLGGHAGSLCRALDAPALRASEKAAAARRDELRAQLLGQNKDATESLWRGTEEKIAAALDEISAINVEIKQIEMSIIPNAKIIGATVTKAYLNPDQFRGFDALILDEASMVLLPAIYFISALVSQKVVIAGDFRQLSPILESDQAAIKEMIGANVFETAGITQAIREQAKPERTVMLTEQYRMNAAICELISRRMYAGRLTTGMPSRPQAPRLPPPFDSALTVIDTSVIQPFSTDRRNMMNALAIRNLVRAFQLDGLATAAKTDSAARSLLGICTPFAKQRDLLQRLLEPTGVVVGTVHRYQGDEKLAMIIDVTDSTGERASKWAKAADPDDEGCKLYNVAVSRAKEHLIFVANLNYLDASLPADSLLRDLLHAASTRGRIIDVREVCALEPIDDDLKQLDRTLHFDPEAMRTCFFTGPDFNAASVADMRQATSGIAIFSGFVTARRVAKYAQLFQQKIAQGVRIRCVTRPPRNNGSIDIRDARGALEALVAMGCIVETRWDIHQKCIIIDDNIVWHGSLNPLSYTGSTDEFMQRAKGADVAREASLTLALDSRVRPDKAQGLSLRAENPRCDACGQRATYRAERGRRVWQCEDACGWEEPFGSKQRSRPRSDGGGTSAGRASGGRSSESRPRASKDHFRTT